MSNYPISGYIAPQLDHIKDAIAQNRSENDEMGFQLCVMQKGETLIDICAGFADKAQTEPVREEHLFAVYSSGKSMAAFVIAHLCEHDRIGYNQLVQSLWPDFGAPENGKPVKGEEPTGMAALSIAQVMSHQSGLSGISGTGWTSADWYDWDKTCARLAAQDPLFPPASASGYSPITFGFLAGEIARRADKQMRSLGQILREDLTNTCAADVWIGLPDEHHSRCVQMQKPKRGAQMGEMNAATRAAFMEAHSAPNNGSLADWRRAEFAGSNCHASARGLAVMMQIAVNGFVKDIPVLSEDILAQMSASRISGQDLVLPFDIDFAAGLMRNRPNFFYGPNPRTLGHSGWGGSCVFADPDNGLHGAYVMNNQQNSLLGDKRPRRLIDALYKLYK